MKKLLLVAALFASTTASAIDFVPSDMKAMCMNSSEAIKHFASFGLKPILFSEASIVVVPDIPQYPGIVLLWRNEDNGNFTVSFTPSDNENVTCVLTYGEALNTFGSGI